MSEIKNLWPESLIEISGLVLPITILQEQAKFLNDMTKNVVLADVETKKVSYAVADSKQTKPGILHTLKIVAPAIGNYDFELLRLMQEGILPYPLTIYAPMMEERFEIANSEELEKSLKDIFTHEKTVLTIQSLISQSLV